MLWKASGPCPISTFAACEQALEEHLEAPARKALLEDDLTPAQNCYYGNTTSLQSTNLLECHSLTAKLGNKS